MNSVGLGFEDDREMARIISDGFIAAGDGTIASYADALFISTTAPYALSCAQELEVHIGKPVVISKQVMDLAELEVGGDIAPCQYLWPIVHHLALESTDE